MVQAPERERRITRLRREGQLFPDAEHQGHGVPEYGERAVQPGPADGLREVSGFDDNVFGVRIYELSGQAQSAADVDDPPSDGRQEGASRPCSRR